MLKAALLFQDHMIIQREKPVTVWGKADPGAEVSVTMQGKTAETMADTHGRWTAVCGPFDTSFGEEMEIVSGNEKITIKDVQAGEVWLAGGQSNMEFHMRYDADMETEKQKCTNDCIRFFDYPEVSYPGQINEADYGKNYGFWRKADPDQLERFSAVGYYFVKEIQGKYQIPVGIIGCNWGGTPACAWMPEEAVAEGGGQIYLDEYNEALKRLDLEKYEENFRNNPASFQTDLLGNPISELMMRGCTMEEFMEKLKEQGIDISAADPGDMLPQVGPKYERRPGGLYESMLKQVSPYTIRGVIWYQGETDGDTHPELYRTIFPEMIRTWRKLWKDDFPFLFVQIAPLRRWMDCVGEPYVKIREAQQLTSDSVKNTGMAVITDVGMESDIHPKKKQPVGRRLALLAENKVYGENNLCEAPTLMKAEAEAGKLILTFENAGDGLYLAEKVPYGQSVGKDRLGGLQIFQNGKELDPDQLRASASGNRVTVSGSSILAGVATEVKLARTGWYLVNLYNSADIPARPAEVRIADCTAAE